MFEDKHNNLWIWSGDKVGIFNTSNFTFTHIPVEGETEDNKPFISFLSRDGNGYAAVYVREKGIYTYDSEKKMFRLAVTVSFEKEWPLVGMCSFPDEGRIFLTGPKGALVYNLKTGHLNYKGHNPDKDKYIEALQKDSGALYVYDCKGDELVYETWPLVKGAPFVNYLNVSTGKKRQDSINKEFNYNYIEIAGRLQQHNGREWFYGITFIVERTGDDKRPFTKIRNEYRDEQSIRFETARNMYEDRQHNIWVGTDNGVFVFNPDTQSFSNYTLQRWDQAEGKDGPAISVCELKDGRIFIGTWGRGLYIYDRNFTPDPFPAELKKYEAPYSFWSIHQQSTTGVVWLGMQGGSILVYDPAKHSAEEIIIDSIFRKSTIRQVIEDHSGNLWFGMQSGHVVKWDLKASHGDPHKGYTIVKSRDSAYIWKMYTDRNGFVWVTSTYHGLFKFDPVSGKQIDHFLSDGPEDRRLSKNSPFDIYQYNDSLILIANGAIDVLNIKTNTISHISTENGLPSNTVYSFERDNKGALWLGLAHGLCRMNLEKKIFSRFDKRDGIEYDNFNPGAVHKMRDGRLIYPCDRNFLVFDPANIQDALKPQDPVIVDFKLANKPLLVDSLIKLDKIELNYNNTSILIEFSSLNYIRQNKIHYEYMLEGIDKDWQETADYNQAIYNYLPPGNYTFKVRAENSDGISSNNTTILQISVSPPFWKTWWFLGVLVLVVISIFFIIDRERIKKLQALQRVRTQIAGNLHHDVNTTLNDINLLSEMAKIKVDKDVMRSKEYIDQISEKSRRMSDAMDDMLWSLNPENDSMEKTILRMKECAEGVQHTYNTNIEMEVDPKVKSVRLDMKARHEFFLIFKEALLSIAERADGSSSIINVDLSGNKLSLKIKNSEVNLRSNEQARKEMSQRAKLINSELDVLCDKNGISIILLVPVH
jgi:signal transduction histidine kinase